MEEKQNIIFIELDEVEDLSVPVHNNNMPTTI